MFDVNPQPERHRLLKTAIIEGEPFEASIEMAIEAADFFSLTEAEARERAGVMARQIHDSWQGILRHCGVAGRDLNQLTPAFEHLEMEKALAL